MNYSSHSAFVVAAATAAPIFEPAAPELIITDGDLTLTEAQGQITITITTPPAYAGAYTVDATALTQGPVNIVPPALSVSQNTLTLQPGLWIYNDQEEPLGLTYSWHRNNTPLAVTGPQYALNTKDADQTFWVRETATDTQGSQSVQSSSVTAP